MPILMLPGKVNTANALKIISVVGTQAHGTAGKAGPIAMLPGKTDSSNRLCVRLTTTT